MKLYRAYTKADAKFFEMLTRRVELEDLTTTLGLEYGGAHIYRRGERPQIYVVHHSAGSPRCDGRCLWRYHVKRLGWSTGGYNLVVLPSGTVQLLTPPSRMSYGAGPRWNPVTAHVCVAGNYSVAEPTPAALQSLYMVLCALDDAYGYAPWRAHRELKATTCPGDRLYPHVVRMRGRAYGAAPDIGRGRPAHYP